MLSFSNVFLLTGSENSIRRNKSSGVMRISFPRMNISLCRKRMWVWLRVLSYFVWPIVAFVAKRMILEWKSVFSFPFFLFCFCVRQDFHIFSPTLVRTKVEVKPVVIVFRYFIFMEGVSMVKLILSYHKSNMNSQFLTDVLWVFSTIWFPSTWESLKRWISAFICAALFPITETTDFFMLYYVIIAEHS